MAKAKLPKNCEAPAQRVQQALMAVRPENMTSTEYANLTKSIFGEVGKKKPSASDMVISWQVNSLLSSPKTALANIVSIPFQGVVTPLNQAIEAIIRKNPYSKEDLVLSDVFAGFANLMDNFSASLKMAKEGYLRGYPLDVDADLQQIAYAINGTKADAARIVEDMLMKQQSREIARITGRDAEEVFKERKESGYRPSANLISDYMNESFDYYRNVYTGPISQYINTPTKVTVGIDEFGKSFFRIYGVQQQIAKKARQDAAKTGESYTKLFNQYRAQVLGDAMGTDSKKNIANLRSNLGALFGDGKEDFMPFEDLKQFAQSKLFQQGLTGKPRKVQLAMQDSPFMRLFIPFMKTPWNIVKEGLSYTPVAPIAKAVLRPKINKETGEVNTAFKGAYYELSPEQLLARQVVGGAAFVGLASMFDAGNITGTPRTSQERQQWIDQGKPPQSIKIGDTWYGYGRIEPVATFVQLYAELVRTMDDYDKAESRGQKMSLNELGWELMQGVKSAVMDKTFLEGLNDMVDAFGGGNFGNIPATLARQAVPTLSSDIARIADGKERQVSGDWLERMQGAAMQRVPVLREMLPEEYGLYGEARKTGSTAEILSGFTVRSDSDRTPLQKAVEDLGVSKVRPNDKLRGIGMSPEQLSEYRKTVAEVLTPRLEPLVNSPAFQSLPKGRQRVVLEKAIDRFKAQAAKMYFAKLRQTDPEFARKFYINELVKKGFDERAKQMAQ